MPWFFYSLLGFALSPGYSLTQKWALNLKINKTKLLTYTFLGLLVCYLIYNLLSDPQTLWLKIQSPSFHLWGLLAAALSLAGNIFSTNAVEKSPNPGYVQAVTSTNALLVLLISIILFRSPITWLKFLGVLVIILGLGLILITKREKKKLAHWQLSAVVAMLSFGAMFLVVKEMANLGINSAEILLILFFYASIGFLILSHFQRISLGLENTPRRVIVPIALLILVSFFTNLFNFMAIKLVSNPGYSTAIFNSAVILTLLLSPLVFPKSAGGEFNARKWLGVAVTVGGILLIVLG